MALPLALSAVARGVASRVAAPSGFLAAFKSGLNQGKTAIGAPVQAAAPAAASPVSAAIAAPARAAAGAPTKAKTSGIGGVGATLENLLKTAKDKGQNILAASEDFSATNQKVINRPGQTALAEKPGRSEDEILGAAKPQDPARGGRVQAVAAAMLKDPRDLPATLQVDQPARKAPEAVRTARAASRDGGFER